MTDIVERPMCECPNCGRMHWKLANKPPPAGLDPATVENMAHHIARPIRGCATDQQYCEVVDRAKEALLPSRPAREEPQR